MKKQSSQADDPYKAFGSLRHLPWSSGHNFLGVSAVRFHGSRCKVAWLSDRVVYIESEMRQLKIMAFYAIFF